MNIKSVLEQVGLTGNQAKVYLALLELGSALAGEITKKSGINRTNVYDALDRLIEKGIVSFIVKANRKYFEAVPQERIIRYLEEKQEELEKKKKLLSKALPELETRRKLAKEPQEATIYQGRKGLKSIAEDILKTKKELLVFGAEGHFMDLFPVYAKNWHRRRAKLKIPVRIVYTEKVRAKKEKLKAGYFSKKYNAFFYETPSSTWIYGDKVAIVLWSEQQTIVTLIRSKEMVKSYRQFFEFLWKNSKK